jgi:hypothetical protein
MSHWLGRLLRGRKRTSASWQSVLSCGSMVESPWVSFPPTVFAVIFILIVAAPTRADVGGPGFWVTTTADDGPGSLRQAILDSNASLGADTIRFAIPGAEVHTIQPLAPLPIVTDPVLIDGFTQAGSSPNSNGPGAGSNAVLTIRLDGFVLGPERNGLVVTAGGSTIRGLVITAFGEAGLVLSANGGNVVEGVEVVGNNEGNISVQSGGGNRIGGAAPAARVVATSVGIFSDDNTLVNTIANTVGVSGSRNTIGGATPETRNVIAGGRPDLFISGSDNLVQGNFIGTDVTGMARGGRRDGLFLDYTAQRNQIGGTSPGARNVISGSTALTIDGSSNNVIQGNYIGVNAAGTGTIFNPTGIQIFSTNISTPTNNLIGGVESGAGNVISGNGSGIELTSAVNTRIQGNLIGVLPDGATPAANTQQGVRFASTSHDNLLGGAEPGAGNVIAYSSNLDGQSSGAGVVVLWYAGSQFHPVNGNAILGNSIFGNAGLGIDIVELNGPFGVTPNDAGDADAGGNNLQNFPVLQYATMDGSNVTVRGSLNSMPNTTFRVEFFANAAADKSGNGEGERFIGFTKVTTDAAGNVNFSVSLTASVPVRQFITATATDPGNNTSEFSRAVRVARTRG